MIIDAKSRFMICVIVSAIIVLSVYCSSTLPGFARTKCCLCIIHSDTHETCCIINDDSLGDCYDCTSREDGSWDCTLEQTQTSVPPNLKNAIVSDESHQSAAGAGIGGNNNTGSSILGGSSATTTGSKNNQGNDNLSSVAPLRPPLLRIPPPTTGDNNSLQ